MSAYGDLYLDDAMCTIGEMMDYCTNYFGYDVENFFELFVFSEIGAAFSTSFIVK